MPYWAPSHLHLQAPNRLRLTFREPERPHFNGPKPAMNNHEQATFTSCSASSPLRHIQASRQLPKQSISYQRPSWSRSNSAGGLADIFSRAQPLIRNFHALRVLGTSAYFELPASGFPASSRRLLYYFQLRWNDLASRCARDSIRVATLLLIRHRYSDTTVQVIFCQGSRSRR